MKISTNGSSKPKYNFNNPSTTNNFLKNKNVNNVNSNNNNNTNLKNSTNVLKNSLTNYSSYNPNCN